MKYQRLTLQRGGQKDRSLERTFWENIARYFIIYYAFFLLMGFISDLDFARTRNDEARLQSLFATKSRRLKLQENKNNLSQFIDHLIQKSSIKIPKRQLISQKSSNINNRMLQKIQKLYYNVEAKNKFKKICKQERINTIPTYDQFSRIMYKGASQLLGINHKVVNHSLKKKGKLIYYYVVKRLKNKQT